MHRPIRRDPSRNKNFYTHNNLPVLIDEAERNKLTVGDIKERFLTVKKEIAGFIDDSPTETKKRTAELQLERLIEQEWKINLLSEIAESEKIIKNLKIT